MANDDRKGLSWMVVLHQGSGSPRRGTVRFHSLETWLFRRSRLLAHTRVMADFGAAVANCPGVRLRARMRLLPDPRCRSVYEEWATAVDVGGAFRARPAFAIDNAITQFDAAAPERVVFNKAFACGPMDPRGWDSYCKGDKRTVLRPRWVVSNRGRSRFRTDAHGRRAAEGLLQVVARRPRVSQRARVLRRRERLRDGAPLGRRHLPRRPRPELGELRVPGLLRDPRELDTWRRLIETP